MYCTQLGADSLMAAKFLIQPPFPSFPGFYVILPSVFDNPVAHVVNPYVGLGITAAFLYPQIHAPVQILLRGKIEVHHI